LNSQQTDADLIAAYRGGDEDAAETLFKRYYQRLSTQVRESLGMRLQAVEEPSDITQSAFRSVFRRTREDRLSLLAGDDLWPLLAAVAMNKIRTRARFWSRQRRDTKRNVPMDAGPDPLEDGPDPQDVAALQELVNDLLGAFSDLRRSILEHVLQGYRNREIADKLGTTERTVYSTRRAAAVLLTRLLEA